MAELHPTIPGACYCGAVSVTVPAPLGKPVNCHCGQCRRLSGAAFTTWLVAPRSQTLVTGAHSLTTFRPTENLERCFCKLCGSHVHTADRRLPDVYGFSAGLFEGAAIETPSRDYFVEHKAAWYEAAQDGSPAARPRGASAKLDIRLRDLPAMNATDLKFRIASPTDAITIAALSLQVFLDTYATEGVRPELAREALTAYSHEAFSQRLGEAERKFLLAETGDGLLGFAELLLVNAAAPLGELAGAELVRLYVQPASHGMSIGQALLVRSENLAVEAAISAMWLTAWDENLNALGFYVHLGYTDFGCTAYSFQGNTYTNRVFAKGLNRPRSPT